MYNKITIYGLADVRRAYKPLGYWVINQENVSIGYIRYCAHRLLEKEPGIMELYLIDNYCGLRKEYLDTLRNQGIESFVSFRDLLKRKGVRIIF